MKKYIVATPAQQNELMAHHPQVAEGATWLDAAHEVVAQPGDWVLDLAYEAYPYRLTDYLQLEGTTVILANVLEGLSQQAWTYGVPVQCRLYGLNALPGFLALPLWEMAKQNPTLPDPEGLPPVQWVADEPGLVTPRVLAMIINEAYYMLQEGTADRAAIDTAMRLGVNYPKGPLAWADEIGPGYIARLLMGLQKATGSDKYAPCRLLRQALYTEQA